MKSKIEKIRTFRDILLILAVISKIWKSIRGSIWQFLEENIDEIDDELFDFMLDASENLDAMLETMECYVEGLKTKRHWHNS